MQRKWFSILLVVVAILAVMVQSVGAASPDIVIGEFRTCGPSGIDDQFVELYNRDSNEVDISGYILAVWDSNLEMELVVAEVPPETVLPAYGHFLFADVVGYSGLTTPDVTYNDPVDGGNTLDNNGGIAIFDDLGAVVDAVGMNSSSTYLETTALTPLGCAGGNQSYARKTDEISISGGGHKNGEDTDVNTADFILVTSSPESWSEGTGPTALTLSDFSAQAQSSAVWLWPMALLIVLSGVLIVSRRRRA